MPLCQVIYDPSVTTVKASIKFETLLIAGYTIDLRKRNSNKSIPPFPKQGDNMNEADDEYELPLAQLNGSRLWVPVAIIDNTGTGGRYEIKVEIEMDGEIIVSCTTGLKELTTDLAHEILIVRFEKGA